VLGYSQAGSLIPAGESVLIELALISGQPSGIVNIVISDQDGAPLDFTYVAHSGCTDGIACNYNPSAVEDDGTCEYPMENYDCDGNCTAETDCAGECGGTAEVDECGECGGDNSTCLDCAGVPNGDSWGSDCGCVSADNSGDDCDDCAGMPNGDNVVDNCDICDSDPSNDCVEDCNGDWGGTAEVDECGECGGDGSSCSSTVDLSIEIGLGWNWFSINVAGDDMSPNAVLATLEPEFNDIVKDQNNFATYYGEDYGWVGSIAEIDVKSMYMISTSNAGTLEYAGIPASTYINRGSFRANRNTSIF
jgi:hypothetical protein